MRRYLAAGLVVLLLGLTSGAVFAASQGDGVRERGGFLAPLLGAIEDSQIVAQLTGNGERYALRHMPMPHLDVPVGTARADVPNVRTSRLAEAKFFRGILQRVDYPKAPPRQRTRDLRAMHKLTESTTANIARDLVSGYDAPSPGKPKTSLPIGTSLRRPPLTPSQGSGATRQTLSPLQRQNNGPSQQALSATDTGAGLTSYWNYEARALPGVGMALLNVGTGNLVIQTSDLDIHERGVDLALTRTYNSQSLHDINGDDGSQQAIFGNQWTNTYDAHLVFRTSGQITYYDESGTRCDYTPDGHGNWIPCTGTHATLEPDPSPNSCSYWVIKTDGTALWFYSPVPGGNCFTPPGTVGRLYELVGRNSNNVVTLSYSFVAGKPQTAQYISQITITHNDGQSATMTFAQFSGYNELATITYPMPSHSGTATISYKYDPAGDLLEVDKPGNDATPDLTAFGVTAGDLPQTYGYNGPLQFLYSCGPRATISLWINEPNPATDGACTHFDFDSNARLTDWQVNGVLNPPIDGEGNLQPLLSSGWNQYYVGYFVYGAPNNPPCTGTAAGTTTMCDTDGHSSIWTLDPTLKVTQTQRSTGSSNPTNLVTKQIWDVNDNLVALTDPRGDQTDIAYDSNGNVTAIALPAVSDAVDSNGHHRSNFRATTLYSYDPATNNLLAMCDPWYTDTLNKDWNGNPGSSDSLCPQTIGSPTSQGATVYQYDTSDSAEPYGFLKYTYTPTGYQTTLVYNHQSEQGDFGLPTAIQGTTFTQNDNSQITEQENLTYDIFGNVVTDGNSIGKATIAYNNVNWAMSLSDPTNVISYRCYNEDGSVSFISSALQYNIDGGACGANAVHYQHDTDGDVTTLTRHYNSTRRAPASEVTSNWFDGLDRLVAVELPAGAGIDQGNTGKTRYIYDLTQTGANGTLNIGGPNGISGIAAYGNLYKTQRCTSSSCNWSSTAGVDINGNAFDALDRPTGRFQYSPTTPGTQQVPGSNPGPLATWLNTYDGSGMLGLLTAATDPLGVTTTLSYDNANRLNISSFSDGKTPSVTATFDLDGRTAILSSAVGSESYGYDYYGRVTSYVEGGNIRDPESLTYGYYVNGWRKKLNISDPASGYSDTYTYDYRADGTRKDLALRSSSFTWTYDNAGRVTQETDPQNGQVIPSNGNQNYPNGITIGPKVIQYDTGTGSGNTGVMTSLTMPNGSLYQNVSYDAEGEVLGFGISFPAFSTTQQPSPYVNQVQFTYDKRGELNEFDAASAASGGLQAVQQIQYWNSHPVCTGPTLSTACASPPPYPTGIDSNTGGAYQMNNPGIDANGCSESQTLSYDGDGRFQRGFVTASGTGCTGGGESLADTRSYDAENHIVQDTCSYGFDGSFQTICGGNATYSWAPSGNLSKEGNYTLHWDGNRLLFVTDNTDSVVQVDVEKLAWRNAPNGTLVVVDRDFSGTQIDRHSGTADHGLNVVQNLYAGNRLGQVFGIPSVTGDYPSLGTFPNGPVFGMRRSDGYQVPGTAGAPSAVSIQGVRTYDSNAQQWTTPDDYKGQTSRPLSQYSYNWNAGNPLSNDDPSGYDELDLGYNVAERLKTIPTDGVPGEIVGWHAFAVLEDDNGNVKQVYSFGPKGMHLDNHYGEGDMIAGAQAPAVGLASCKGMCPWESQLNRAYKEWPNGKYWYWGLWHNSNGALSALLADAGFGNTQPPLAPGWVPGWDDDDVTGLKTIAHVKSRCYACDPWNTLSASERDYLGATASWESFNDESDEHMSEALGL